MKYCVITLDLVNSRKISDRKEVQDELKEFLKKINHKYENILEAPFAFTLGDEVQGVIKNLHDSYPLIRDFQQFFQGRHFYAGVGFDKVSTSLSRQSGEMDGPAFHLARSSVEILKDKHLRVHSERFTPLIHYSFTDSEVSSIVNNYLRIIEMLKYELTDKQSEVYWLLFVTDT
ncbi:MAG: SatD family protein, partial [Desulfobacterales bacterium]|nr:SatD family protein [Desulfobacterales bacterium]